VVVAFAEDAHGALWIAYTDRLMRVRDGAPPEVVAAKQLPPGDLQALLVDRRGRLWIAINDGGIVRIDDPAAARPRLVRYSVADGLASDQAMTLVEDAIGRIYVGTTHGIDRIEPDAAPGAPIAHFDIADGLPNDYVFTSIRTRDGVLWFGTKDGAARLDPRDAVPTVLPPTYLAGVAIDGQALPTPLAGARGLELELGPHSDQLDLTFTIPVFAVGDPVKFQYRLDGADSAWSAPVRERGVHYARLAPGSYQFNVRAVAASGAVAEPATVVFTVLAPIWQRGWFIALCGLAIGAATYVVVRGRLRHALAIERVRTRIATDLHDELGANLSRISILSEVAVRRTGAAQSASTQIDEIGKSARELVDVAADIVWSTDPRRDDLGSVIARLRAFAGDVLEGREVEWTFTAPREPGRIKLDPDQRRHLYLIAKEAIHNVAKHAGARRVEIAIAEHERGVRLVVRDDGRGFDPAGDAAGNGLSNMRARAREAGGSLVVESRTGDGTTIAFTSTRRR
jgi:signal transduction histidine kinase